MMVLELTVLTVLLVRELTLMVRGLTVLKGVLRDRR